MNQYQPNKIYQQRMISKIVKKENVFEDELIKKYSIIYLPTEFITSFMEEQNPQWKYNMTKDDIENIIYNVRDNFRFLGNDIKTYELKSTLFIKLIENLYRYSINWDVLHNKLKEKYYNDYAYIGDVCFYLASIYKLKSTKVIQLNKGVSRNMEEYIYIDFDREVVAKKDIENNENIFFYYYQEPEEDFNSYEENDKDDYCWLCTYESPCECPPKMEECNPFEEDEEDHLDMEGYDSDS